MGARHDIFEMVKRAQSITGAVMPYTTAKNVGNAAGIASHVAWGGLGAFTAPFSWAWDKTFGGGAQGSLPDYIRTGARVGTENADLMNASVAQGVADFVPFADGLKAKAKAWADSEQQKRMAAGLGQEDAINMRSMASLGGNLAPTAVLGALSRGTGAVSGGAAKLLGAGNKVTNAARVAGAGALGAALVTSGIAESGIDEQKENTDRSIDGYRKLLEDAKGLDPSSPEYAEMYGKLKLGKIIDPEGFGSLPVPKAGTDPEPEYGNGWTSWYNGLPDWQKTLAWGAGGAGIGALLGSLFGGKGSGWKMALLGMLLGAMGGNGNIGKLWNSIRGGQKTQAVG